MLSIRTQDRMTLVPYTKQITISKSNQFNMVFDNGDILPLGIYATKERALEVLDEIEQHTLGKMLIPNEALQAKKRDYDKHNMNYSMSMNIAKDEHIIQLPQVYQMPIK